MAFMRLHDHSGTSILIPVNKILRMPSDGFRTVGWKAAMMETFDTGEKTMQLIRRRPGESVLLTEPAVVSVHRIEKGTVLLKIEPESCLTEFHQDATHESIRAAPSDDGDTAKQQRQP